MDLTSLTSISVRDIAEELTKLEVKEVEIPIFSISNWPKDFDVSDQLGKKDYHVPVLQDGGGSLLKWHIGRNKISFQVHKDGSIRFKFHGFGRPTFDRGAFFSQRHKEWYYGSRHWVSSDYDKNLSRLATVVLFDQFKVDIFLRVLPELKNNSQIHNQVIEEVKKAFEPFIPFIVLDQLTS